jgi:hypothetical protein
MVIRPAMRDQVPIGVIEGEKALDLSRRQLAGEPTSHEAFDSGVVLGAAPAARLLDHGRQAYAAARRIETMEQVNGLEVVRDRSARA